MSSWETGVTASSHDAGAALSSQIEKRKRDTGGSGKLDFGGYSQHNHAGQGSAIGAGIGYVLGGHGGAAVGAGLGGLIGGTHESGYSMVGINGGEVTNMRKAVVDYVVAVQTSVDQAIKNAEDGIDDAFRGADARAAVIEYLEKVKLYITNLISQLESFADKIADVGNAWIAAQESFGSNVKTATGNFSEGTAYTQNVTYKGGSGAGVASGVGAGVVAGAAAGASSIN